MSTDDKKTITATATATEAAIHNENAELLRTAMAADAQVDKLKAELQTQLEARSKALGTLVDRGIKKFVWRETQLTIFRKNEGLFSLKGKKKEDNSNVFTIDG